MKTNRSELVPGTLVFLTAGAGLIITNSVNTGESGTGVSFGPYFYPSLILWLLAALSAILLVKSFLLGKADSQGSVKPNQRQKLAGLRIVVLFAILLLYCLLFFNIGFMYPSMLALFALLLVFGRKVDIGTITISIATPAILYVLFTYIFDIALP
ncbi:tripartite tricarboxylate transporter TctB family protein [Oceanimonas smirnovii]|uniref:Tripartite tricarboxylate transporter TctB family protein n=1 Tax=Oceanimonas smirnovii TaxID=264574 RepID=A0ABW7NYI9_9GAMM